MHLLRCKTRSYVDTLMDTQLITNRLCSDLCPLF
nr:MAG TPA: hypothetical protein [Bacteriophage sp.]